MKKEIINESLIFLNEKTRQKILSSKFTRKIGKKIITF